MRALAAAFLPLTTAAACTSFGLGSSPSSEPELPPEAGAADADAPPSEGGSETQERDALADAQSCGVVMDDFEDADWQPQTKWIAQRSSGSASWGRASNNRPGSDGAWSLSFDVSAPGFARLGQGLEQRCTLRFTAWLYVSAHNSTNSRILSIETTDGATIDVMMRDDNVFIVDDGIDRATVPLVSQRWVPLVLTYTMGRHVSLKLDEGEIRPLSLPGRGPAKRFNFGLLGAESGSDQVLFDDVELEF